MFLADKKFILASALLLIAGQIYSNSSIADLEAIWWLDMVMHFLGGLLTASLFLNFSAEYFNLLPNGNRYANFLFIVSFVMLIGVLWEFYEYSTNYFLQTLELSLTDTLSDLFFDLVGGILGGVTYLFSQRSI
ncbi:MAG: hypothetical protein HZB99_02640 [Candidatus Harrisonbacteria bacterium]|nr:hypothetical protein [Candidatus Harrisonbacteria bacterium]